MFMSQVSSLNFKHAMVLRIENTLETAYFCFTSKTVMVKRGFRRLLATVGWWIKCRMLGFMFHSFVRISFQMTKTMKYAIQFCAYITLDDLQSRINVNANLVGVNGLSTSQKIVAS